jgi:hypothetical protein
MIGRRGTEGTSRPAPADALAATRIEAARRCGAWTELDPNELVERERGYVVHAESDECYLAYRGDAFSRAGAVVSDRTPLAFYVLDGDVVVLERQGVWSDLLYQRERARARTR